MTMTARVHDDGGRLVATYDANVSGIRSHKQGWPGPDYIKFWPPELQPQIGRRLENRPRAEFFMKEVREQDARAEIHTGFSDIDGAANEAVKNDSCRFKALFRSESGNSFRFLLTDMGIEHTAPETLRYNRIADLPADWNELSAAQRRDFFRLAIEAEVASWPMQGVLTFSCMGFELAIDSTSAR